MRTVLCLPAISLLTLACGPELHAKAVLKDWKGTELGVVTFTQTGDDGLVTMDFAISTTSTQATAGNHAMHIHEAGDCTAPSFASAKGHWNPGMHPHGDPTYGALHHAGDLGNIVIDANKSGARTLRSPEMSLASGKPNTVLGLAVIIHAKVDDFVTQSPPGNAGARIGCGVITAGE